MAWRDRDTLQLGIDPRRAVAVAGLGRAAGVLLPLLDGSREHGEVLVAARERGIPADAADRVIGLLAAAGVVEDFPAAALRTLPDGSRARLASELAAASLAHGQGDGGARILARRQAARVRIYGSSPAGAAVASLLTASGIGYVSSATQLGPAAPLDPAAQFGQTVSPGSPAPGSPATRLSPGRAPRAGHQAGSRQGSGPPPPRDPAVGRPARGRPSGGRTAGGGLGGPRIHGSSSPGGSGPRPDLAILSGSGPPELPGQLTMAGIVHLAVSASEAIGVVGPLVIPGQSACLQCLDLARQERDPSWPLILAQITGRAAAPAACSATLAAAVAAQAAAQALALVDLGRPPVAVINGTLELVLPGWQWRRRSWAPHPRCRCSRRSGTWPRM
jgi:bacteriocin biosynthesis cyclodehydratase domain-containing protein